MPSVITVRSPSRILRSVLALVKAVSISVTALSIAVWLSVVISTEASPALKAARKESVKDFLTATTFSTDVSIAVILLVILSLSV